MDSSSAYLICPNCQARLAPELEPTGEPESTPSKPATLWSDGQLTTKMGTFIGSIASCPECWAVFPNYVMQDFLSTSPGFSAESFRFLPYGSCREMDNSTKPFDLNRTVVIPTFKTWRMTGLNLRDDDPILYAQAAESFMHVNNDRLRSKVLKDENSEQCIFDKEGTSKDLELFVARVKNGMISADSFSQMFSETLGDFFGTYRLYFLCAEISRSIRKFEWADEFISKIDERRNLVQDFAEDLWEFPKEATRVSYPTVFWLSHLSELRLEKLRQLVNNRDPYLATVVRAEL